jgi:carboxyl-terminal processing protease
VSRKIFILGAFLLIGCSNNQEPLLFDQKYESMCEAMSAIGHYALEIHATQTVDQYLALREISSQKYAEKIGFDKEVPAAGNCDDIEAFAQFQPKKSKREVYSAALLYFMQAADPHSLYIAESNVNEMKKQDKNIANGVGIEPKYVHRAIRSALPIDTVILDYVYPGTPAHQKLKPEDEIESFNGEALEGKYFTDVAKIIAQNPKSISVKVKRLDEPVTLTQHEFEKPAVYSRLVQENGKTIKWIRITRFVGGVSKQLEKELRQANAESIEGVILDLRGNPGGLVDEGVNVLNMLLFKGGEIFRTEGHGKNRSYSHQKYNVSGKPIYSKSLIVMVDSDTASIAEVVAETIKHKSRGLIIGNKTFGKGSVQVTQAISNMNGFGGLLITTVSVIYYPDSESHQITGVIPDYILKDQRFDEAVATLKEKKDSMIIYESEYDNAILPYSSGNPISQNALISENHLDEAKNNVEHACDNVTYQKCLETYATRFLEIMING